MESLEGLSKPRGLPVLAPATVNVACTLLRVRLGEGEVLLLRKFGPELGQGADDAADILLRMGRDARARVLLAETICSLYMFLFAQPTDQKDLTKWATRSDDYDAMVARVFAPGAQDPENFASLAPARPAALDAQGNAMRLGPQQLDVAPRLETAFRRFVEHWVTPFVLKEVWGFRGNIDAEHRHAHMVELKEQVWPRAAMEGEAKRRELEDAVREHKALFGRAMGVPCEGALGVESLRTSCGKQRPALASVLDDLGADRAARAISMLDADRAVFDTLVDAVLVIERSQPTPEFKASAASKEQTAKAKKRRLKKERQAAKPAQGQIPEGTEVAAAAAQGGAGKQSRQSMSCFTCGEDGHRLYEKDKCKGCGYCGEAHQMSKCPKGKEVREMAREKFRSVKPKGVPDAETSDE